MGYDLAMPRRPLIVAIIFFATVLFAPVVMGQAVPVNVSPFPNGDPVGQQFAKSLQDGIELSDKFKSWQGAPYDIPKNGIVIYVYSIQAKDGPDAVVSGSAIFADAIRPSKTERGYFKTYYQGVWYIPSGNPVSEEAVGFLAELSKKLKESPR